MTFFINNYKTMNLEAKISKTLLESFLNLKKKRRLEYILIASPKSIVSD